jgi:hypothetical protein
MPELIHDTPAYDRALAAERRLRAIERMIQVTTMYLRRGDTFCSGCYWTDVLKPLLRPLVGWERGRVQEQAKDPSGSSWLHKPITRADLAAIAADTRAPAETDTETWLRTQEAWHAVTDVLLARLDAADPAHGHGYRRATRTVRPPDREGHR